MKAYKIKSPLYLSGSIIAAVVYYQIEQEENFQQGLITSPTADLQAEDDISEQESEETENDSQ